MLNSAIAGLTLRQVLAKRRWLLLLVLGAIPVVMALLMLVYSSGGEPIDTVREILRDVSFAVVVPVVSLVLANAALGAEIDDGTIVYLLTKPLARTTIGLTKLVVAATTCVAITAASTLLAGMIGMKGLDATHFVIGCVAGTALGALLYTAIFLTLGLVTRRGLLIGLVYLVVWEGAASSIFPGTRTFSVRQYMMSTADTISTVDASVHLSTLTFSTAWQMSIIVAIVAVALGVRRLRAYEIGQAT